MRYPMTLALTVLLAAPVAAQTAPATTGTVQEVTVLGTSELLANFLRATLSVQPGAPLSSVNLRQLEQEVIASGYFKSAVAELRTLSGKDTLVITVVPNATIKSVEASGLTFLPVDAFKNSISELLNIAPGATLNTQRIEQAKEALARNYQTEGFPFTPSISSEVKANPDGTVTVNFIVDESVPVTRVEIEGVTLLSADTVKNIFKPVYDARKFDSAKYYQAVQQLQQAYDDAGYLQSGVDVQTTRLQDGVLKIKVLEGTVSAIDLSALGNPQATLQTQVSQPVNLKTLQADVRTLANLTGKPVGFAIQPNPQNPSQVVVLFGAADVTSGPVKTIAISGNTLIPTASLQAALKTKTGDVYTPQLAQEDFMALRDLYRKAGYEISTRDAITFEDGTLTYNIREVKLVSYELQWQGKHRTVDRVILRELPQAGTAFNRQDLSAAIGRIYRLGIVEITSENVRSDPQNPESVTLVLGLKEAEGGLRGLGGGVGYDSLSGWNGDLSFTSPNVFGLGHNFGIKLGVQQNEAKQNFSGNVSYTIPWLDLNFLDFQKVPTSLSFNVGSSVTPNNAIYTKETDTPAQTDTGWDYSVRDTGFSVSTGRSLGRYLSGSLGVGLSYKTYHLEALQKDDKNTVTVNGTTYTFNETTALGLLPVNTLTTRVSGGLNYDSTDSPDFPGKGVRGNLNAGYNFGKQGTNPVNWTDIETGASTYVGFGKDMPQALGYSTKQQVFAVRANAGTQFGTAPTGTYFTVGGGSSNAASRHIRGIADGSLLGTNYFTTSAEYRYDFGLKGSISQGLYGVLFADAGSAWGTTSTPNFNLKYGIGAGIQFNLGYGGSLLAPLRFDYGFNPQTGSGNFYFRLGGFW